MSDPTLDNVQKQIAIWDAVAYLWLAAFEEPWRTVPLCGPGPAGFRTAQVARARHYLAEASLSFHAAGLTAAGWQATAAARQLEEPLLFPELVRDGDAYLMQLCTTHAHICGVVLPSMPTPERLGPGDAQ